MASEHVQYVTDDSFERDVVQSPVPVLIDFTATWCGPCKALAPTIDKLALKYEGRLRVVKLDIDNSPNTPSRLGIRGVPTVILFKGGQEVARHVGLAPESRIEALFTGHLAS